MNRASGITVSPGTNSSDIIVVGIRLGDAPRSGVSVNGGAAVVDDSHVVEGEGTDRSRSRTVSGRADRLMSDLSKSSNLRKSLKKLNHDPH